METDTQQRVLPRWPLPDLEPRGLRKNSTSHPAGEPGLMGESIRGTERQAWNPAKPDLHGARLVPKSQSSSAQIQEGPASGLPHSQEKHGVFGWTESPVVLWMFPDLCAHRLQY